MVRPLSDRPIDDYQQVPVVWREEVVLMAWFLVKIRFVMSNGDVILQRGWYKDENYMLAAEQARLDRQWDLRPHMKKGEFTNPEQVVSAEFTAKRYKIKELVSFDRGQDEITNKMFSELPGATREDIAALRDPYTDSARWRVPFSEQREGFGGIA